MVISKKVKQLMKILLVVFMSVTIIVPDGFIKAEAKYLSTDKELYLVGEPIMVTVTGYNAPEGYYWAGIYPTGANPDPNEVKSSFWVDPKQGLTDGNPVNILGGTPNVDYPMSEDGGIYDIILLYTANKSDYNEEERVTITIKDPKVITDKPSYKVGEDILVSVKGYAGSAAPWVGVYDSNQTPGGAGVSSVTWYDVTSANDTKYNIGDKIKNPGKYTIYLFSNYDYAIIDSYEINVRSAVSYITTDKEIYEYNEPIMVTVNENFGVTGYFWVGIYDAGATPGDSNPSYYWFDGITKGEAYNIFDKVKSHRAKAIFTEGGDFDIVLFDNDKYSVADKIRVTIKPTTVQPSLKLNKKEAFPNYKYGEEILLTAIDASADAWVGLYDIEGKGFPSDYYRQYCLRDYDEPVDILKLAKEQDFNLVPGTQYRLYLVEPNRENVNNWILNTKFTYAETYDDENPVWEVAKDLSSATLTLKRVDDETKTVSYEVTPGEGVVTKEPTCTEKGIMSIPFTFTFPEGEELVTVNDTKTFTKSAETDIKATGHEWGEPTWKWVGHKSATAEFTCKNDPSHKVTIVAEVTTETDNYNVTATATVKAPNGKVYTDVKTESELDDNMKFRLKVSSREGEARGSVTGTVYSDYHADIVIDGELVNENNLKVEMWMHNVGSLGVEGLRYYGTEFTPSSADKPHSLDTIRTLFDELCDGTTSITGKINDKSVKYTFVKTNTRDKYEVKPDSEDNARDVWHELFNEDTVEALTEESDDSKITIKKGSYLMIGEDRLQFEEGKNDLVIDNLGDIAAMDAAIRDHVELVSEEGNTTVEVFLDKGSVVKVGQSYVKLLKEVKAVIDIDPAALEGELENIKNPAKGTNLISNFFGLIVKVLGEVEGNNTTVEFRFGHKMTKTEKVEATCTEEGSEEYWTCEICGRMFADEEGKNEIEEPAVIAALGHDLVHHEAVEATCAKEGNKEYWECSRCGKLFSDKNGNTEVTKEEVIIPLVEHKLVHHDAVEPECEKEGNKEYWECSECGKLFSDKEGKTEIKKEDTVVAAKGHDWSEPEYKWSADNTEVTATRVCKNDKEHVETETVKTTAKVTKEATCEEKGETTYTAEFKNEAFKKQEKVVADIEATGHKWNKPEWKWNEDENGVVTAVATFVCANDPKHVVEEKAEVTSTVTGNTITHEAVVKGPDGKEYMAIVKTLRGDVVRIFGNDRYETGLKAAEFLADIQGIKKFDNVVLTTGQNFPDALSGAYLARTLNAPILLIKEEAKDKVQKYIKEHLNEGGEILVLGGENAVKEEWLGDLGKQFKVSRVRGDTRYLTNIDILNKVDYKGGDILVCTGKDYADSLSGSAVDMPILLVNDALTREQTEYLSKIEGIKFHIVGGTSAVSASVEKELAKYGEVVERFAGETRYETSTLLAEAFFENAMQAVLAYGVNFPDGLCGGVIAAKMGAPLIVTISGDRRSYAADYCGERSISSGAVLGGSGLIDDVSVRKIFMMNDKDEIVIYERE